jgi:hypothetical protein
LTREVLARKTVKPAERSEVMGFFSRRTATASAARAIRSSSVDPPASIS